MNTQNNVLNLQPCLICGEAGVKFIEEFGILPRITSDCRPYKAGGKLGVCKNCSAVQKIPDEIWFGEISQIYKDYSAYEVGDGSEQLVVDEKTGNPRRRSEIISERIELLNILPDVAMALDVGCGHGVTLDALSNKFPNWRLFGHELDSSKEQHLLKIRNFTKLFTCELLSIEGEFNFISMIHSLEHFSNPFETLCAIKNRLNQKGVLFIEVCNVEENPFDILVADHLTHFSPQSLGVLLERAGYRVLRIENNWVKKELSAIAIQESRLDNQFLENSTYSENAYKKVHEDISWLHRLVKNAENISKNSDNFGIFGTSIAGTWLASVLKDRVKFFVDEDLSRIGKDYMGLPILSPQSVPAGSDVFLALAPILTGIIKEKLSYLEGKINFHSTSY